MITVWHQSTAREKREQTDPMSLSLFFGPVPNLTHHVHLRSYRLTMADACAFLISPFLILAFRRVLASAPFVAIMRPRSALLSSPHLCKLATDFYPIVKAALRHESADSEEDREGLGGHLGQGLLMWYYGDHSAQMCSSWSSSADRPGVLHQVQREDAADAFKSLSRYFDVIHWSICSAASSRTHLITSTLTSVVHGSIASYCYYH